MQGNFFMQLLIILALLLYGGGGGAQKVFEEVKPVLETLGNDSMKEALKNAEEISSVLTAVRAFTGGDNGQGQAADFFKQGGAQTQNYENTEYSGAAIAFPLKPVNSFIDRDIAYSLSKYIREH